MSERSWPMRRDRRTPVRSSKPFGVAAVVLLVFGVLAVLLELQSSSLIYFTGEQTTGTNNGGIVYYQADGQQYTIDAPGAAPARPVEVSVFYDRSDPNHARLDQPARWFDVVFVLFPFVAAAVCLAVWARRRAKGRRRHA